MILVLTTDIVLVVAYMWMQELFPHIATEEQDQLRLRSIHPTHSNSFGAAEPRACRRLLAAQEFTDRRVH